MTEHADPTITQASQSRPRHWLRVSVVSVLWALWAVVATVFAFAGAIAIALAFGPVSLGPVAPLLLRSVSDPVAGYRMDASDALLAWSTDLGRLVIRFVDPRVVDDKGIELAAATDIAVSFSLEALLNGRIAPRSLQIAGPTATFMKLRDGSFDFGIRTESRRNRQVDSTSVDAGPFIEALLQPPVDGEEETYLSEIRLTDATLTFIDQATDSIVKAPRGTLVLERTRTGLKATLDGQVSLPKGNWGFHAEAAYDRSSPVLVLKANLDDVNLDSLTDAGPMFDPFAGAAVPLNGTMQMAIDVKGVVRTASVNVTAGTGHVQMAALSNKPLDINSAEINLTYDRATDIFALDHLVIDSKAISGTITGEYSPIRHAKSQITGWKASLLIKDGRLALNNVFDGDTRVDSLVFNASNDFDKDLLTLDKLELKSADTTVTVAGTVQGLAHDKPTIKLTGGLDNVPLDRLRTLWPKGVSEGARNWIAENTSEGRLVSGKFTTNISNEALESGRLPNEALRFELAYEGVRLKYMKEMPPLEDTRGTALLLGNRFEGRVDAGHVGNLRMTDGLVVIGDLNTKGQPAEITGVITGKASEVLTLIDHEPLGYPSRFGLDAKSVGGDVKIDLGLVVPTLNAVTVEQIVFDIKVALSDVAMEVVKGIRLTGGKANFAITGGGLTAEGTGKVAGVAADFSWKENFNPGPGETSTYFEAHAKVDEALRQSLGVDPGSYLDGTADVSVSMTGNGFKPVTASANVDLEAARVRIPELGYSKEPGVPARMTAELERVEGGYHAFPVALKGKGIDAELDILLGPDGALRRVKAERLVAGRNDVGFTVDLGAKQTTVIADVSVLDLDTLIEALSEPGEPKTPTASPEPAPPSTPLNVYMRIKAKRVFLRGKAEAQDLQFNVNLDRGWLKELYLSGKIGRGTAHAQLAPLPNGGRQVAFTTDDMGLFIQGATGFASLSKGRGQLILEFPPIGTAGDPAGTFVMRNFRLTEQPFLVRLLEHFESDESRWRISGVRVI